MKQLSVDLKLIIEITSRILIQLQVHLHSNIIKIETLIRTVSTFAVLFEHHILFIQAPNIASLRD